MTQSTRGLSISKEEKMSDYLRSEQEYQSERFLRYESVKRTLDIILSTIMLVALSPVMLVIALIIFLDDPKGSSIFSQMRCGRGGRQFTFYKFRTMVVESEKLLPLLASQNEMVGPAFKIHDDPRITNVGRFLRRTSLDELPQLWNVLRGEMSLVGPRPPLVSEYEQYSELQRQRLLIKPGITCFWQIQPHRNSLSFDEWLELDFKYIHERCFTTDIKILFYTLHVIFTAQGE
jgi:lipopolysaccharide/colanic/teichoic acid biosynthesis glycosyltransferase